MKPILIAFLSLIIFTLEGKCQEVKKTHAFFMIGNYNYPKWEKIEFDLTANGKEITYSYARKSEGIKLNIFGPKKIESSKVLMVKIPVLSKVYYITPDKKNKRIIMKSADGKYNKKFLLGYEGPVNGVGTFCETCANEPDDAFKIVDSFIRR